MPFSLTPETNDGRAQTQAERTALADANVIRTLDGATPKKIIVVPGRIVNVVV